MNNILSDLNNPLSLNVPQTNLELSNNVPQSTCVVTSNNDGVSDDNGNDSPSTFAYSLMSYPLKLNTNQSVSNFNKTLISNTIRLLSYNTTTGSPVKLSNQNITIVLQHTEQVIQPINTNVTFNTTCKMNNKQLFTYLCTYTNSSLNYTLNHYCNGTSNYILYSQCPYLNLKPSCDSLMSKKLIYECIVKSHTSYNTTCFCTTKSKTTPSRYLSEYTINKNKNLIFQSQQDGDNEEQYALDVSISLHSEFSSFYYTWSKTSTQYDSIKDVKKTLLIIIMYGSLWFIGFIGVLYCYYKKQHREKVKSLEAKMKNQGVKSMKKFTSLDSQNFFEKYISSIFPLVFREETIWNRLYSELITHHRYLIPFYARGDNSESMLMFILAVLYDAQYPNKENLCGTYYTQEECLQEKSPYDSSHVCEWTYHPDSGEYTCDYIVPQANYQVCFSFPSTYLLFFS